MPYGARCYLYRTTVFGRVATAELAAASDVLFVHDVQVMRQQVGYLRYCFVPDGSRTPTRFHCEPDESLRRASADGERAAILARLRPSFTSTRFGDAGYAQLSATTPWEIRAGASGGSEMGAFGNLHQARRITRLREALDEYLRYGLDAGVFTAT
ncbi:MAG: hypothetical protein FJ315_06805 [SAR202 cluster bacterium]|nr:hypothetical protein [SAR202 cluster bacterium]